MISNLVNPYISFCELIELDCSIISDSYEIIVILSLAIFKEPFNMVWNIISELYLLSSPKGEPDMIDSVKMHKFYEDPINYYHA